MRKYLLLPLLFPLWCNAQMLSPAQTWDSVKNNASPIIATAFIEKFDQPFRLPLADYGWEDGLQISSDGLNLYALYTPGDLLGWYNYITTNVALPLCNTFGNTDFLRPYAQTYGMDLTTNFFGCDTALNIDILYAHRNTINDAFESWQLSDIARPALIEGGPFPVFSKTNPAIVDHFIFTGNGDIWMINNTSANPNNIASAVILPSPINPVTDEFIADNPMMQRINNSDTLLIIYEKYTDGNVRDFMYAFSYNDGLIWESPVKITSVNNDFGHIEHPQLFTRNGDTYLYYSLNYDIYRSRQAIVGNWDSWVDQEAVILKGNALALGEPSLCSNGDMTILIAYENTNYIDAADRFDCDPWYLKNLDGTNLTENIIQEQSIALFPNPANTYFVTDKKFKIQSITIRDLQGNILNTIINPIENMQVNIENLSAGLLIVEVKTTSNQIYYSKLIHF